VILTYLVRLACLSFACFFLAQLLLGVGVSLLAPVSLAMARRARPRFAADVLFAIRMFPASAGVLVVALVCVPSYLWLEADAGGERVGLVCLGAALIGLAGWAMAIARGLRAMRQSLQYERRCRHTGRESRIVASSAADGSGGETALVVDDAGGMVAMAGIARPQLVVSRAVLDELSAEQLEAALQHERAHRISRDNLKRLLLLLTPDIFPGGARFLGGLQAIERGWARFTEWAADDFAVAGDARRRASLAAALVRVARLGGALQASPLMTSLMADRRDLEARVARLLDASPARAGTQRHGAIFAVVVLLCGVCAGVAAVHPATLQAAHRLLEYLLR
jgi:Zn-dependent protease with chaperone function